MPEYYIKNPSEFAEAYPKLCTIQPVPMLMPDDKKIASFIELGGDIKFEDFRIIPVKEPEPLAMPEGWLIEEPPEPDALLPEDKAVQTTMQAILNDTNYAIPKDFPRLPNESTRDYSYRLRMEYNRGKAKR